MAARASLSLLSQQRRRHACATRGGFAWPSDAWRAGTYELLALDILEDLAGNQIGRAFDGLGGKGSCSGAGPEQAEDDHAACECSDRQSTQPFDTVSSLVGWRRAPTRRDGPAGSFHRRCRSPGLGHSWGRATCKPTIGASSQPARWLCDDRPRPAKAALKGDLREAVQHLRKTVWLPTS